MIDVNRYRVTQVPAIGPELHHYPNSEQTACGLARSLVGSTVRVYRNGQLIAQKQAGADRLEHIEVKV